MNCGHVGVRSEISLPYVDVPLDFRNVFAEASRLRCRIPWRRPRALGSPLRELPSARGADATDTRRWPETSLAQPLFPRRAPPLIVSYTKVSATRGTPLVPFIPTPPTRPRDARHRAGGGTPAEEVGRTGIVLTLLARRPVFGFGIPICRVFGTSHPHGCAPECEDYSLRSSQPLHQ